MYAKAEEAWSQAARCAARAEAAFDPDTREMMIRVRDAWIGVANKLEFTAWAEECAKRRDDGR
jgi:hypothetical protein